MFQKEIKSSALRRHPCDGAPAAARQRQIRFVRWDEWDEWDTYPSYSKSAGTKRKCSGGLHACGVQSANAAMHSTSAAFEAQMQQRTRRLQLSNTNAGLVASNAGSVPSQLRFTLQRTPSPRHLRPDLYRCRCGRHENRANGALGTFGTTAGRCRTTVSSFGARDRASSGHRNESSIKNSPARKSFGMNVGVAVPPLRNRSVTSFSCFPQHLFARSVGHLQMPIARRVSAGTGAGNE